jgi:hypothetical protein
MSTILEWLNMSLATLGEACLSSLIGKREINCLETQVFEYAIETGDILEYPPTNKIVGTRIGEVLSFDLIIYGVKQFG